MLKSFGNADPKITEYAHQIFKPEDSILREIRERSLKEGLPQIQLGDMDALHLEVIVRAIGAKKAVEIGTLAGYSGTAILRGLGKGGELFTFEYSAHHAKVSEESFRKAGFSKQVKIFIGPAIENLSKVEYEGPFDVVFIDADKESYPAYLDWATKNLRPGGVVLADNTFAFGMIADQKLAKENEKEVKALREFNIKMAQSEYFRTTIFPTGEGLTMGVKIK